jgi:ankyrin repeat protein
VIIKLLLQHGADVNLADVKGQSALMIAAQWQDGDEAIIKLLLQHGADINLVDVQGQSALMITAQRQDGNEAIIKLLLHCGADVNLVDVKGQSALLICVQLLHVKAAELLLQYGADVNAVDKEGKTVVKMAFYGYCLRQGKWNNFPEMVKILLLAGLNEQNQKDALSLVFSIPDTHEELVRMLFTPTQTVATAGTILEWLLGNSPVED